jgi:hypothetical protein
VSLLGPRRYAEVPAYLQHADVVIVPHVVSPFTESLDPIKAYECLAIDRPTVATPVAGFREHAGEMRIAERSSFPGAVADALASPAGVARAGADVPSWELRSREFEDALGRAAAVAHRSDS